MMIASASWLPTPPDDTTAWVYYSLVIAAVVVIGIAKSGFGGGSGELFTARSPGVVPMCTWSPISTGVPVAACRG